MRFWFRHRKLEERAAQAAAGAEDAAREAERSRQRLEAVRENVVTPMREAASRNQFADMLRRSLIEGHHP